MQNVFSFSKEQISEYKAQFDAYDEDKSGTVEKHELQSVLAKCGVAMSDQQVADMVKGASTAHSRPPAPLHPFLTACPPLPALPLPLPLPPPLPSPRPPSEFDEDNSGNLDFQEFINLMHKMNSGPTEKDIRKTMFELFDQNLDGFVSLSELLDVWRKAAAESNGQLDVPREDVLKSLIAEADSDGDGQLSEAEFYALVEAVAS